MKKKEFYKTYPLNVGDRVIKKSGKPFKSGLKVGTIKDFTKNPHSGHDAVVMEEDGTIVNIQMIKPLSLTSIN